MDVFDAGATSQALGDVISQGPSCGISIALTSDIAAITRHRDAFSDVVALGREGAAISRRGPQVPGENSFPPGRGTRMSDDATVHIAIDEPSRTIDWPGSAVAEHRIVVRQLPQSVTLERLATARPGFVLGVGGDDARTISLDLAATSARLLVCGPPSSGKSTTLIALAHQALARAIPVCVVAQPRSPLAHAARTFGLVVVQPADMHPPIDCAGGVLLVDDIDQLAGAPVEDVLISVIRSDQPSCAVVASADATAASLMHRGAVRELRQFRSGLLLQPRTIDGELFGLRLSRMTPSNLPGRGLLIAKDDTPRGTGNAHDPLPIQVAVPGPSAYPMCG
jgi:S-DNA-T family DNA segregation ATPase FtsK/SpoIIIE